MQKSQIPSLHTYPNYMNVTACGSTRICIHAQSTGTFTIIGHYWSIKSDFQQLSGDWCDSEAVCTQTTVALVENGLEWVGKAAHLEHSCHPFLSVSFALLNCSLHVSSPPACGFFLKKKKKSGLVNSSSLVRKQEPDFDPTQIPCDFLLMEFIPYMINEDFSELLLLF